MAAAPLADHFGETLRPAGRGLRLVGPRTRTPNKKPQASLPREVYTNGMWGAEPEPSRTRATHGSRMNAARTAEKPR